jgi:hypothetical protein
MAETLPFALFFNGLHFAAPNKRTSSSKSTPVAARLARSHREQRCQDLGPWRMSPLREGEVPLGVGWRSRSSCFLCFVCVSVVVIVYFWF